MSTIGYIQLELIYTKINIIAGIMGFNSVFAIKEPGTPPLPLI